MMGGTVSCNGLDFLFNQSPNGLDIVSQGMGHRLVMCGTLFCDGWNSVL